MVYVHVLKRRLLNAPFLSFKSIDKIMSRDGLIEIRGNLSKDDGDGGKKQ